MMLNIFEIEHELRMHAKEEHAGTLLVWFRSRITAPENREAFLGMIAGDKRFDPSLRCSAFGIVKVSFSILSLKLEYQDEQRL
jgi:hypothetical protein